MHFNEGHKTSTISKIKKIMSNCFELHIQKESVGGGGASAGVCSFPRTIIL
jgi:hypothetical protein